jgi:hypothetical protein
MELVRRQSWGAFVLRGVSLRAVARHATPKSHAPCSIDVSLLATREHLLIVADVFRSNVPARVAQAGAGGLGFRSSVVGQ